MNSLHECVTCKDVKEKLYLLPCLHPTCSQCIEEIVQDAKQKKWKLPGCRDCGEPFVQDKLIKFPSHNNSTSTCSFDCDEEAACYCGECRKYMCKVHSEAHRLSNLSKPTKSHVIQLVVEVPFCNKHSTEIALGFCTHCKLLICGNCSINEHNKPPHLSVSFEKITDFIKNDVDKLLESTIPAIDKEIKKHTDIRTKLEKERADLEAKIGDIRKQEKVTTLQIEDLEKTKALLLTTQTQVNTLASTATTIPHSTLLRLQSVITARVSNLQAGLGLISGLISSSAPSTKVIPVAIFNRVFTEHVTVSNNGKTVTNNTNNWAYAISNDGCSSGVRSWRLTINAIPTMNNFMFGIWNSSDTPSSYASVMETSAWLVNCHTSGTGVFKAGAETNLNSISPFQSGDVILLTVDANQRCLTVKNTTRAWTYTIDQLPSPNPAYYPHVLIAGESFQVSIQAA